MWDDLGYEEDGWIRSQGQEYQHFLLCLLSSEVQICQVNFLNWWKFGTEGSKGLFRSVNLRTGKNKSLMRECVRLVSSPRSTENFRHHRRTELVFTDAAKVISSGDLRVVGSL